MYAALILLCAAIAVGLFWFGRSRDRRIFVLAGALFGLLAIAFFSLLDFWGEHLWFKSLGYNERFWTSITAMLGLSLAGCLFGVLLSWGVSLLMPVRQLFSRRLALFLGALIGVLWGYNHWETLLKFIHGVNSGVVDPFFSRDAGFYLFSLPWFDGLYDLLLLLALLMLLAGASQFLQVSRTRLDVQNTRDMPDLSEEFQAIYIYGFFFLLVLALGSFLERYHLLYSEMGVVNGPGWTDMHIRLPMYWLNIVFFLALGSLLLITPLRERLRQKLLRRGLDQFRSHAGLLASSAALLGAILFLTLNLVPNTLQWLRVEPNEISLERPYIKHNIRFTRKAFKLDQVEEREFPASEEFTSAMIDRNRNIFENIRLWDWRALEAVYDQFQEIRLYYEFQDVDIDRYTFADNYRQVMVSAREMDLSNLPEQSQTFINRRFIYTHGYGITLSNVSEFTNQGLPDLLIRDIPPVSRHPKLEVDRPEIYYGELTTSPAVVNTREEEFDFPKGEQNAYIHYPGKGGVQLSNLWRKFIYGWMFDGTRFFLSSNPTPRSRFMFHRQIRERLKTLAPFLEIDQDPYIVLADGQLYWVVDAYTTSEHYPYSENFSAQTFNLSSKNTDQPASVFQRRQLTGMNYLRNSVKAVVNAFSGQVDFYVFDSGDPLIQTWDNIFPELFKPRSEMPDTLQKHVRYPDKMLLVQGMVYAKYHMTDPTVFYNQEDLWIRATEKYHNRVQPVEPYYVMWEPPDRDSPEYVLIQPFTPKNRQVLIGWMAGMCDGENYGRLLSYKFPKEKRILGPQQVETKIDQDSYLSGQLTLWDQRGSQVIRGNVLAIPIEESLIYVEPIYLQAETAAYPELRLVVIMHSDELSYATSFDKALEGLIKEQDQPARALPAMTGEANIDELVQQANQAFRSYLRLQNEMEFEQASEQLRQLHSALEQLMERVGKSPEGNLPSRQ